MKRIILILPLTLFMLHGFSQKIHSTGELIKIMSDSEITYEIDMLNTKIECKDLSDKLNYHDCYRISTDSVLVTNKFSINDKAKPLLDKAENFFASNISDSALLYYELTLATDSSLYYVMTYIGQIYYIRGDYQNAILWYKRAIDKNFIDYMAHWFLADSYLAGNKLKHAADEIAIAQILNRNNPRIKKSMIRIFEKDKRNTEDWCFNPQMELNQISSNKISIAINEKWVGYAMAKAIWTYEPGYKESMGVAQGQYSTLEDKECLAALVMGLENAKIKYKKDPQLRLLKEAIEKKHLNEYILYEIVLPQTPFVAFQLPEQTLSDIKDYVLTIRHSK